MDVFTLWDEVLDYVKQHDPQYHSMFSNEIYPVSFQGNILTLAVEKPQRIVWLRKFYLNKLSKVVSDLTKTRAEILIQTLEEEPAEPEPAPARETPAVYAPKEEDAPFPFDTPAPLPEEPPKPLPFDISNLRPKKVTEADLPKVADVLGTRETSLFPEEAPSEEKPVMQVAENKNNTFENFVYGVCNRMAYEAALSVAESSASKSYNKSLNPLFIYGPAGLGKTHLLHAIRNYVGAHAPQIKALFLTSETFTNELVNAINTRTQENFRRKYRTVDMLLIDDVQFFGGRDSSAFELFNTFNMLFDKGKYIVMTSDRTPSDIKDLEDRLQSRFSSGLLVGIDPPDIDICCAILKRRAAKDGIDLPQDVTEFIAKHINKNVRVLEGAYNSVKMYCSMQKRPIDLASTREALATNPLIKKSHEVTVDTIIDTVCAYYEVSRAKLLGPTRPKKIAVPRQIAMYLCRAELGESFPALAEVFHKKDHTSVLYAYNKVQDSIDGDPSFKKTIEHLHELLKK